MRLALALALLPGLAAAEDVATAAPVAAATIYRQGIALERRATVMLPAGAHRILMPATAGQAPARVTVAGATLVSTVTLPDGAADGRAYFTDAQRSAYDALRAAEDAAARAADARDRAAADVRAAEDALGFLRGVSGAGVEQLQPDAIGPAATAVAGAVAGAEAARAAAAGALREAERATAEAELALAQARRDLDATGADLGPVTLLALSVAVAQAGPVEVAVGAFEPDAGWSVAYDLDLGADGGVTLARRATIRQASGLPIDGAALRLSTADPFAQTAPAEPQPDLARAVEPPPLLPLPLPQARMEAEGLAADAMVAAGPIRAVADTEGPVVAYDVPAPVDVPPDGDPVDVALGDVALAARAFNRAAPRLDATAFRMAAVTNSTGEPILAGPATLLREGQRVGETVLPLLPAGDEADLAFGPVEHLRLEYRRLDNETGDRGLLVSSGTRRQDLVYRVRNLSDAPEAVEALIALPFSEQEDLVVDLRAVPPPDATDVDDRRGVGRWDLVVPAGGEAVIAVTVAMRWPEGLDLAWEP